MTKTIAFISAIALAAALGTAGAQAAPTHRTSGELASKGQLAREHARAMKAGDTANDPANSASSDALNQQQLAKAQALPGADVQPGAINSSGVDSNSDTTTPASPAMPNNNMPNNNMPNNNMSSTPSDTTTPQAQGMTPDNSQSMPQSAPSTPQGNMPSTTGTSSPQ